MKYLASYRKRARRFARGSIFWYRMFGAIEVILGVSLPLLFVFPGGDNVGVLAPISVLIAVSAALRAFWGWRENWGTYKAQNILLTEILAEWELALLGIIAKGGDNVTSVANKQEALERTRATANAIFGILRQEHDAHFSAIQSPDQIAAAVARNNNAALQ
ncbi:SLATT domain-containing protein [Streptomyces violarus]|uniref:SLATT domain-containing protein n=1 Tax=Streptomyces violarus TaxID=67380 RepID=UPI0021BE9441|nr:SLATT domain-containing protein [Streptomyces violarus]MCT9141901.1 SLATT domain-containing protein [Streptomyces violarus]